MLHVQFLEHLVVQSKHTKPTSTNVEMGLNPGGAIREYGTTSRKKLVASFFFVFVFDHVVGGAHESAVLVPRSIDLAPSSFCVFGN